MDRETFDDLMRRVAGQTSRRAALSTLVGGALLLRAPDAGEATKKAKRRKTRKRHARRAGVRLKPTWVWLVNGSTRTVRVVHGQRATHCCNQINAFDLAPGDTQPVAATYNANIHSTLAFVMLNNNDYWFTFVNPNVGLPEVAAASGGQPPLDAPLVVRPLCCGALGEPWLRAKALDENQFVEVLMASPSDEIRRFRVQRNTDMPNYKVFTVTIPDPIQ